MVSIDYSLILVILNFIVLMWLLNKFIFQNVKKFLKQRQEKIATELKETEEARIELQGLVEKKEAELKKADAEIRAEKKRLLDKAEVQAGQILKEAKDKEKEIIQESKHELLSQKSKIVQGISDEVAVLVAKVSEKIIGQKIDEKTDAEVIRNMISKGI